MREIRPGDVNWMSAGRGVAHSERTPRAARVAGEHVHGIQSWVALPDGQEDGEPTFVHYPAATLPRQAADGVDLTVIAGEGFGLRSPVATLWPTLYAHAQFTRGAALEVPADYSERAVYVVQGELAIGDSSVTAGQLALLEPEAKVDAARARGRASDAAGGRAFSDAALHLVEFRGLLSGAHRAREGKLAAAGISSRARRNRIHSIAELLAIEGVPMTDKTASVHWEGQGKKGVGKISTQTDALKAYPYGYGSRFEDDRRGTNPEELLAAAHSCLLHHGVLVCVRRGGLRHHGNRLPSRRALK